MSIATAITALQGKIANAYTAIENKGGTLPATQNAENLSATIDAIPSGGGGSKWGMTLDEICNMDENGYGGLFTGISGDLIFSGLRDFKFSQFNLIQGFSQIFSRPNIRSVSFPDLSRAVGASLMSAFYRCTDLTSVSFPSLSVTENSMSDCFRACTNLSSVTFPELVRVGDENFFYQSYSSNDMKNLFNGCTNLTAVSFPKVSAFAGNGVLQSAFYNCKKLVSVSFPNVIFIGGERGMANAFENTSISSLDFPELTGIGYSNYGLNYTGVFKEMCKNCSSLVSVSFPKLGSMGVTNDYNGWDSTFINCSSLTAVSIPVLSSMRKKNCFSKTFANCTGLLTFSFPAVTDILSASSMVSTFYNCTSLTSVSFPMLTACANAGIENNVFGGCTNLTEIHFRADSQTMVEGLSNYSTKWGAPNANCQIYFDL